MCIYLCIEKEVQEEADHMVNHDIRPEIKDRKGRLY